MTVQILLGPQHHPEGLKAALTVLGNPGPVISITAGWRDSEGEVAELANAIDQPVEDLMIYHRAQEIFAREAALRALQRERQDQLVELQRLYRIRLNPALLAARSMLRAEGDAALLRLEQRAAISTVRALDRHHVRRITAIHQHFDQRRTALDAPSATAEREVVQQRIAAAGVVLIAGGHVAVLLNRIRLFRLGDLLAHKPVIAWSAGAMVLAEQIVLFHDDAPQGKRDAEVLDAGLGITRGIIPLPHARLRLDWSDRIRMALFARRFAPAACCTLDERSLLRIENHRLVATTDSCVMTRSGQKKHLVAR